MLARLALFRSHWRTTGAGVALLLTSLGAILTGVFSEPPGDFMALIQANWEGILAGGALLFAADAGKVVTSPVPAEVEPAAAPSPAGVVTETKP